MLQSLIHPVAPKNFIQNIRGRVGTLIWLYFKYQMYTFSVENDGDSFTPHFKCNYSIQNIQ